MDYKAARAYARRIAPEKLGTRVKVSVPINAGTHHTIALLRRDSNGEYEQDWRGSYPSGVRALQVGAETGSVVYQRTTSPASAEALERYGVVRGDGRVDWGSDADWIVDFGPMGDVTRRGLRSPSSHLRVKPGRVLAPTGEEVAGGTVEEEQEFGGTTGGGSG